MRAESRNKMHLTEKDSLHVPKGLDRSKQAQIDALLNAITHPRPQGDKNSEKITREILNAGYNRGTFWRPKFINGK